MTRALVLVSFLGTLAACEAVDDRPATFSYIHAAIIVPNCATSGCHSTLTKTKGIDLEDKDSAYVVLQNEHFDHIDVVLLITGNVPPGFYRMPPDQPLPNADINLIKRWTDEGRQDN
jgi:hypothetical protein